MKKRFVIVVNPAAGNCSLDRVGEVCRMLRDEGHEAEFQVSQYKGNCTELTREALDEGVDVLVAAGGDGTVNEIANALAGTGTAMAVFPRGTVNILAMEIGLRNSDRAVAECLLNGAVKPITLGRVNGLFFVAMAGVGVDARAVAGVTAEIKEKYGKGAYVRQALAQMLRPARTRFRVTTSEHTLDVASVVVCNAKRYAGSFRMAPEADVFKPQLDVCAFDSARPLSVIKYSLGLLLGVHHRFRDVRLWDTNAARIECLGDCADEPLQVDGDAAGFSPCSIEAVPDALNVVVPPHST